MSLLVFGFFQMTSLGSLFFVSDTLILKTVGVCYK